MLAQNARQVLVGARLLQRCPLQRVQPSMTPFGVHKRKLSVAAAQQTASQQKAGKPLRAPGSESNFVGLPADRNDISVTTEVSDKEMQEHIELARASFPIVFKDILDKQHFESNMFFSDPISRFTFFRGYQFNVTFLRLFLAPIFEVHEIKQAGPREMVIKWSWTMNFWWLRYTPFKVVWDPRLTFTGITILGYSESGKWNKHVDAWDAIKDNEFFSFEAAAYVLKQMFQVAKPPNRFTPEYAIMMKFKDWEIRSYKPFVVAQIAGKPMDEAETRLRAYLGGANERRQRLDVTTPLWRNSEGAVFFALPGLQDVGSAPAPSDRAVTLHAVPERWYAAWVFTGHPTEADIVGRMESVRVRTRAEGTKPVEGAPWLFARYNDRDWPWGPFRRNEALVEVDPATFDLWRGVDWAFVERIVKRPV